MPLFTSKRERNLWLTSLILATSIMSTVSLAQPLSTFLSETGLLPLFFILGMVLLVATALTHGFSRSPRLSDLGLVMGVLSVYLFVLVRMEMPAERTHLIEYGILAIFIHEALKDRARHGRKVPVPPVLAILITAMLGSVDEGIQAFIPGRVFDIRDILFNGLAAFMTVGIISILTWSWDRLKARHKR